MFKCRCSLVRCTPPSPRSSTREHGPSTARGCAHGRRAAAPADRAHAPRSVALFQCEAGAALTELHAQLDALDASEVRWGGLPAGTPPALCFKQGGISVHCCLYCTTAAKPYTLSCRQQEGLDLDASALRLLSLEEELAAQRRAAGNGAARAAGPHPQPRAAASAPGAPPPGAHAGCAPGGQPAAAGAAALAAGEPAAGQRAAAGASGGDSAAEPGGGAAAADTTPGAEAAPPVPAGGPAAAPGARADADAADIRAAPASRDMGAAPAAGAAAGSSAAGTAAAAAAGAGAAAGAPARRRGKAKAKAKAKAPPEPAAAVRRKAPAALARLGAPDVEEAAVARLRAEREARTIAAARVRPPGTSSPRQGCCDVCMGSGRASRAAASMGAYSPPARARRHPRGRTCAPRSTAQARRLIRQDGAALTLHPCTRRHPEPAWPARLWRTCPGGHCGLLGMPHLTYTLL